MPGFLTIIGLRVRGARYLIARQAGQTRVAFGTPSPRFVRASAESLAEAGLNDAWVAQVGRRANARLLFSANVPARWRQRIRNRWTPPRERQGGGRQA